MTPHIAIIGGGPSGLMAAEILATAGLSVTIYDRMPSIGRKLLMAGRGGLNLTHSEKLPLLMTRYGEAAEWLAPSIKAFPPEALRHWCEGLGQPTFIGSSGRVFPKHMKATPLLRAWLQRLEQLGVRFATQHQWQGWQGTALQFTNAKGEPMLVTAAATLLALGGASWPRLGSNGEWVSILKKEGIDIAPFTPANCGFKVCWSEYFRSRFAGMPLKAVSLQHEGITQLGEVMITAQGIEGGGIYALSSRLRNAIAGEGKAMITLDLRPTLSREALIQKLGPKQPKQSFSSYLRKAGFSPLVISLFYEVIPKMELLHASAESIAAWLKALPITLGQPTGLERAISTAGGIKRSAITQDFMLQQKPGLFVAGEMIDWEAPTGGYLLQACFSMAVAAARGIITYVQPQQ